MKKAVTYIRVSSKGQKEEGFSIPAQKKELQRYARKNGIKIVQEFEEAETAKTTGRPVFDKMVRFLRKNKSVENILVEKTDRLTRNFRDYVTIAELRRNIHYVKEGHVMGPDARASDKLIHDIKLALAKNYIDNLSEETRKGMLEKAEQGLFPSYAPMGYLNDRVGGGIVIDWSRAHLIRQMFEEYAAGGSVRSVKRSMDEAGMRTRKGNRVAVSAVARMLRNPIYTGDFEWGGRFYEGKHEPLISRVLFDEVQSVKQRKDKPRAKTRKFAFRGLLKCGVCGCSVTAEIKKEQYVYYRCTHSRGNCTEKPIREEKLAVLLGEPLKRLKIKKERLDWIVEALRESHEERKTFQAKELKRLEEEREDLERKIDKLYEDKLAGIVETEFWERKYREYKNREIRIGDLIEEHRYAKDKYLEDAVRVLELAKDAHRLYVRQEPFEKRRLLDMLLSNCTLQGGQVKAELTKLFKSIADGAAREEEMRRENAPESAINDEWLPG